MAEYTTDADKAKRDRYLYVMALLVGQRGEADLEGKKIEGVLHTSTPFANGGWLLDCCDFERSQRSLLGTPLEFCDDPNSS